MIRRDAVHDMSLDDIAPGPGLPPLTPDEVLLEEFMRPLALTARALAAELGVPGNRISSIVAGTRAVTAETALPLARRFGTSVELWLNLQTARDLAIAREEMMARGRGRYSPSIGASHGAELLVDAADCAILRIVLFYYRKILDVVPFWLQNTALI